MTAQNPTQAIIEYLSHPSEAIAQIFPGTDHTAKTATIHFLKVRSLPHSQFHAVTFEDINGQRWHEAYCVELDTSGHWSIKFTVGSKAEDRYATTERDRKKYLKQPWVKLSMKLSSGSTPFWARGDVINNGFDVAWVRLIGKNGLFLEDTVHEGLILFLTEQQMLEPVEVELYSSTNTLVGKQIVP